MRKNAILLTVFMMISKVFGIIRESVLAYFYGRTAYADIYFTASLVPTVLFGLVAAGLVSTFIPIYSRVLHNDGEKKANEFLDNVLSIVFVLTLLFTAVGLIFTEELVFVFAKGFKGDVFTTTVAFVRVSLFAILFNGVFSIFNGYQQYHNRFLVAPVAGFILNFFVITSIIISAHTNPIVMAYGLVFAAAGQAIFTYWIARSKSGYKFNPGINLQDEYLKPMLIMAVPIILGSSINQVNTLIDRNIASGLMTGAIATLNYASKISDSIYGLFVTTITTVMYPTLTKQSAKGDFTAMKETVNRIMNTVVIIVMPSMIGLMVLAVPVVDLFYGRGEFAKDPMALSITSATMFFYAIGIIGYGLRDVLTRTFYALHDSMTPVISGFIAVVINLILNLILAPRMGVPGLALATSISAITAVIILYISLYRKIPGIGLRKFLWSAIKITFAAVVMGVVVHFVYKLLLTTGINSKIILFASAGLGAIVYAVIMMFMNVPEYDDTLLLIKKKLKLA
ncbi:murein biosynthesis integral membrane protein MurJ [Erysipelothrix urinaevulpis]|uniref:murein biosynthesis integral membrane protein MurJ n=1 Tax=Erysipelothrix urinaevulpis TaxID=2683717 RepID=UPI00135A6F2E|nr:murein biosynthesis integral membrane protein MurJ [Erysipelothrix urinaevulpis]